MRITDIRSLLHHPARLTLIEVHTDAGIVGLGSTGSPPGMIEAIIDDPGDGLRLFVVGQDPTDPEALWQRMAERWAAQRGRADRGGLQANAMGAIDMAVWDIAGKAAGKPVHELLGGARRDRVLAYGSASTMSYVARKKSYEGEQEQWLREKSPEEIARRVHHAARPGVSRRSSSAGATTSVMAGWPSWPPRARRWARTHG